ncbi:T4 immunity holin family protein [Burkholderia sp. WP9]|uniref:superinfection immunity protein n=1 Tax=Burkholderia sp. WP9 TaxID=1500263 RepID=UPI00089D5F80|nr:superinfection immunity protein [Burkholderia sp. WP9]SEC87522.1 T4 immunity holin family protein [Burkholderia sp. WP9]
MIALALLLALYFLPAIIALSRKHHNAGAIIIVNLFFGWTFIGWVWTLAWAAMNPPPSVVVMASSSKGEA